MNPGIDSASLLARTSGHRFARGPAARGAATILAALAVPWFAASAAAQTHVAGWGVFRFDGQWSDEGFAEVQGGSNHTVARRGDGSVVAWGHNGEGQCLVPPSPAGMSYLSIATGSEHTLALRSDLTVVSWGGNNLYGERNVPPLAPGLSYVALSAGAIHSVGLLSDGSILVWGNDQYGQRNVPALPAGLVYTAVSAGAWHTAALRSDGSLVAWGRNVEGECDVPALPAGLTYSASAAGDRHTLALRSDGSVVAFGENAEGQCNVPALPVGLSYVSVSAGSAHSVALRSDGTLVSWGRWKTVRPLPPGLQYVAVDAGGNHTVALRSDQSWIAWGYNYNSQCGAPVPPPGVTLLAVQAGVQFTIELRSDGTLKHWGNCQDGECDVPPLPAGLTYAAFSVGDYFATALRSDGAIVAWGSNTVGQCDVPALPAGLSYSSVAAGSSHALALRSDGSLVAWGRNAEGQCDVPALPAGLSYVELAAGDLYSMARRSDGSVVTWGVINGAVPVLPPGVRYVELAAGLEHALARRSDGAVAAWGRNTEGECVVPALPSGLTYTSIGAGWLHSMALRSDGSCVAWGDDSYHQCEVTAPPNGDSYVQVDGGAFHSVSLLAPTPPPCFTIDFETEDDLATPLENGQRIDTEFGRLVRISGAGANLGPTVFDTTPGGPNDPALNGDMLIAHGNVLLLQHSAYPLQTNPGFFDTVTDDDDGGDLVFDFLQAVEPQSLLLADINPPPNQGASVTLIDASSRARVYAIEPGWTGGYGDAGPQQLDLTTTASQPGNGTPRFATATEDPGFQQDDVVRLVVHLTGNGALDELRVCLARASASLRNGSGGNPSILGSDSPPALGSSWSAVLDCSAYSAGLATMVMRRRPTSGVLTPFGEVLVAGALLSSETRASSGAVNAFTWSVPNDVTLVGLEAHVQGLCQESASAAAHGKLHRARGRLSNALDLVLGF